MTNLQFLSRAVIFLLSAICFCNSLFADSYANANAESLNIGAYRLATGDKIKIQVFGEDDLTMETVIGDTGKISYPFLGEIGVDSLNVNELARRITEGLKGPFLLDPKVTVFVLEYRPFFISGEVGKPGGYAYQPGLTLRKALALAGGLSEHASPDDIVVIRETDPNKQPQNATLDSLIFPGDSITINEYRRVYVNGEVKSPGGYPFKAGLTLRKAIALAGGFSARASQDRIEVIREDSADKQPIFPELDDEIRPGDIITIRQSFF